MQYRGKNSKMIKIKITDTFEVEYKNPTGH